LSEWNLSDPSDISTFTETVTYHKTVKDKILSLKMSLSSYLSGSVHPVSSEATYNFDLTTGKNLGLSDFLSGDYLNVMSSYVKRQLSLKFSAPENKDLGSMGSYESSFGSGSNPTEENYGSFLIDENGLTVVFGESQVAASSEGEQLITVPWSELSGIMKPGTVKDAVGQ
jgi:hypothetical protein